MKRLLAALFLIPLLAGCGGGTPTYEAEPIDGGEDCFAIERVDEFSDDDTELGTFCRQGGSGEDD